LKIAALKAKALPRLARQGTRRKSMDAQSGTLGGPSRTAISSLIERSVFRANLHRLHAGFRLGPGLEHAVIDDGRCGGRLFVDDGALFCVASLTT